jgi:hypothetical protein
VVLLHRFGAVAVACAFGLVLAWSAEGCTVGATQTTEPGPQMIINVPDAGASADAVAPQPLVDGGTTADVLAASPVTGSPLCNASATTGCFPDDGWACEGTADAGATTTSPDAAAHACRVVDDPPHATCDGTAGTGGDAAPCTRSSDCAAGYECVGSAATAGQCRHYCCDSASCNTQTPDQFFCDIQPTATASASKVPVCMPVMQCQLLQQGVCPDGQQCSIVTMDGTTSCVAIGQAQLDAPCDTDHCAAGLVCLGMVGSRVCWQLCSSSNEACPTGLQCHVGGPLVPEPQIGICDK